MKKLLRLFLVGLLVLAINSRGHAQNPSTESPELAQARARLLADYERGLHEDDNDVKSTKQEIARLEYLATHAPNRADNLPRLVSVNFSGGPMSALIAAADKSSADGFNVVAEKADLAIELPAFTIRNADPSGLASALDGLLRQRGYTLQSNARVTAGQAPVYVLRKLQPLEIRVENSPFQSFQLASYLESQTVDDIISAIRTAWELDPSHKPEALRLKFHPPTGILLVSAPTDGIYLVQSVLTQLKRTPEQQPKQGPKAATKPLSDKN